MVDYADLLSLYVEFKDIFCHQIYWFESSSQQPVIIDGGGFIGMSVLYFKSLYPSARITCFEPDPGIFQMLKSNVRRNGCLEVNLIEAGLADREGVGSFLPDGMDGGRIAETAESTNIRTVLLSHYLSQPVDFVKLNIEGMELPVLQEVESAGRLRNIRNLVLEYHGWTAGPQRLGELLQLLDRNGFRYLVHDFDSETNFVSKPPFQHHFDAPWFVLVSAQRMDTHGLAVSAQSHR